MDLDFKKAKTHKGRKILDGKKSKAVEGPKNTLFLKGNKTNETVTSTLHNLHMIKKTHSVFVNERWDLRPFETVDKLENVCNKKDCGLFVFGSNTKKRPNSLYMGRIHDEHILDLVEFEINKSVAIDPKSEILPDERPILIFQGDVFEYESNFMRIKNLIGDLFIENVHPQTINVKEGLRHFIVITGDGETNSLHIRQYELQVKPQDLLNGDIDFKNAAKDIGPSLDLTYRRANFANDDVFKKACKQPKPAVKKHMKNITTNALGEQRGRVFLERQNLGELNLKKRKKLKRDVPTADGAAEAEGGEGEGQGEEVAVDLQDL